MTLRRPPWLASIACLAWLLSAQCSTEPAGPCPQGTRSFGGAQPGAGVEQWCESKLDAATRVKHGPWTRWWSATQRAEEGFYEAGQKSGPWRKWNRAGQLVESGSYLRDQPAGAWLESYDGGNRKAEMFYVAGKLQSSTRWYEDGQLARAEQYLGDQVLSQESYPDNTAECRRGSLEGCFGLARMYQFGNGVERDEARAREIYEKACNDGHAMSCTQLAFMLQLGKDGGDGGALDAQRARALLEKACRGGDGLACHKLKERVTPAAK